MATIKWNVWWVSALLAGLAGGLVWAVIYVLGGVNNAEILGAFITGGVFVLFVSGIIKAIDSLGTLLNNLTAPDGPPPSVPLPAFEAGLEAAKK